VAMMLRTSCRCPRTRHQTVPWPSRYRRDITTVPPRASAQVDPELLQQRRGRIAVRHHAELLLLGADIVAQVEVDVALEVGDLVAERGELLLQRDARVARQRMVVGGPARPEWAAAGEAVGEMAD